MSNLTPVNSWDDVFQLETQTPVLGGAGGVANLQAQSLLNRFEFLEKSNGASRVGFKSPAATSVTRTVAGWLSGLLINVKDFGATGNGVDDDTTAVENAISYAHSKGGGVIFFENGTYKLTRQIEIPYKGISFLGTGKRGVYPGIFSPSTNTVATLLPVHNGRSMIRFYSADVNAVNSFVFKNMACATLETGDVPIAAFGWDCSGTGAFQRDFTFKDSSIHGFTSAFDVYGSGTNNQMGLFKADNCNINRNSWIARTLDGTQWNGFSFTRNEAGQNGYPVGTGGINIQGHSVHISDNCMEGQRDPIRVYGSMRGVSVYSNYFEAIIGRAGVELDNIKGPFTVGPNTYLAIDNSQLSNKALGSNVGIGTWNDPVWLDNAQKNTTLPLGADTASSENTLNIQNPTETYGILRADVPSGRFSSLPQYIVKQSIPLLTNIQRDISPLNGAPMPVTEYTTAGTGAIQHTFTVAGSSGQYVVFSGMFKLSQDAGDDPAPYISMLVNGAAGNGSRDYVLNNYNLFWLYDEWVLVTCAIKLTGEMTSLTVRLFPFGVSPTAGRVARYAAPTVYLLNTPTAITPFVDGYTTLSQTSPPTTGAWQVGDRLINLNPSGGGQAEFLYTSSGWVYG